MSLLAREEVQAFESYMDKIKAGRKATETVTDDEYAEILKRAEKQKELHKR